MPRKISREKLWRMVQARVAEERAFKHANKPGPFWRRVRNIQGLVMPVVPGKGPKPKRYPVLCHGVANHDCVACRVPAVVVHIP